eukprot:scaffold9735_cov106-Cylindrotheca_fusiformis.AAC.3
MRRSHDVPKILLAMILASTRQIASFVSPTRKSIIASHHPYPKKAWWVSNGPTDESSRSSSTTVLSLSPIQSIQNSLGFQREQFHKAQSDGFGTRARNAAINATVGDILVPLCSSLEMRQQLANRGVYAGVEYEICTLQLASHHHKENGETETVQTLQGLDLEAKQGVIAMIKPAYPLRDHLERDDWPVEVQLLEDVPFWLSKATYEAGTAMGTLALSSSFLVVATIIAFFVRFVAVPTPSMVPALNPGNIILVTRTIPPLWKPHLGDVVFFDAPSELDLAVQQFVTDQNAAASAAIASPTTTTTTTEVASSTKGKQFLKRVVAVPGESVGVKQSNPYVQLSDNTYRFDVIGPYVRPEVFPASSWNRPATTVLRKKEYFVAGDNGYRSVDSRVWGPLQQKYIVGTAQWVLWPLNNFGPVPPGQISEVIKPTK